MRCTSFFRSQLDASRAAGDRASESGVAAISAESNNIIIRRVLNLILKFAIYFNVRPRRSHQRALEESVIHKFLSLHESVDRAPFSNRQPFPSLNEILQDLFSKKNHRRTPSLEGTHGQLQKHLGLISNPPAWAFQATKTENWGGNKFEGSWVGKSRQSETAKTTST